MTGLYVRSDVQSLISQTQLKRNMSELSDVLTRLSTGLRINSGKDDPAGLIASELMKSDITATSKAISNTQRANSVIAIADSSLGQVSNLLNDIKGLIVEAANTGAMSAEQIAANQLQVDASLDSIDRISKTTNYQGQLLLDGSMDFQTQGLDNSAVKDLKVFQANFGTQSSVDVAIQVSKDAGYAQLFYDKAGVSNQVVLEVSGNLGNDVFKFEAGSTVSDMAQAINQVSDSTGVRAVVGSDATYGQIMLTSAGFDNDLNLMALTAGSGSGNYTIKYSAGNSDETTYTITEPQNGKPGVIDFKLKMQETKAPSATALDESFNGIYSYDIDGNGLIVQSNNGTKIRQVEIVEMTGTPGGAHPGAGATGGVAATFDKASGKLQIQIGDGADVDGLTRAINSISGLRYVAGAVPTDTGYFDPIDVRPNNAINIAATIPGSKFENTDVVYVYDPNMAADVPLVGDVSLAYKDGAQYSAATLNWADGYQDPNTGDDYDVQMRISAKEIGSAYNDVTIEFEQDDTFDAGTVSAVYDAKTKILHIRGQVDNQDDDALNATYGAIKAAIEENSPFRADVKLLGDGLPLDNSNFPLSNRVVTGLLDGTAGTTANKDDNAFIRTGQVYGDIGTDHQAIFVRAKELTVTANDVIAAFNDTTDAPFAQIAANFTVSNAVDSDGSGQIFGSADPNAALLDANLNVRLFSGALTGGSDGWTTAVTSGELADFINNDERLSQMFRADIAQGQAGTGLLTLFDEAAYYGDPNAETGLQFLGPEGSPDILFVTDGPNSQLGISFSSSASADCVGDDRPIASLLAQNANAAFTVQALTSGDDYDNMAIRMIRLDNNHLVDDTAVPPRDDSYAQYTAGPSTAMAYCSINSADTGTNLETGKFIVYGVQGGTQLNNVSIVAKLDTNQTDPAQAYYDEANKQLVISVQSTDVTLSEAVAAINDTGIFHAEYDYSFNQETGDTGAGLDTFEAIFSGSPTMTIGNTGNTGGYNGVLEVYIAGDDTQITSQRVVDTINRNGITGSMFSAKALGGADAGTGIIDFRADNIRTSTGSCGEIVTEMNLATGILGSANDDPGYMIVHLATDANGNSITSARDLVNFMDSLTAEQTRGISVSLVRPAGVDNLNRTWTVDSCGNVIMNQACDDDFGKGILNPTMEVDECDNVTYFPIEFYSYGEDKTAGNAYGSIVAVNGIDASLSIYAKNAGSEYNGVGFKYVQLTDPLQQMYADYDALKKEITVYIQDGTTAAAVKNVIESSEATKDLFRVELAGTGTAAVTTYDDYLILKHGIYDAGYRGGAHMLGATDADPHRLVFESTEEGSNQRVSVRTIVGDFAVKNAAGKTADTAYGTDMIATINGLALKADGRKLSLDSSMLKMEVVLDEKVGAGDSVLFSLTGGGATFQVGPDVVTNQQIRLGIQSVNTARLGGASGRLYQLRSGNNADLSTDTKLADQIVAEAILSIAMTRGRLGAIQRSTLEPTIASLQDSLEQLTSAEAQISNADFAEESSRLTRAQILVQSGTRTLQIANQFPQYAASLLGG